MQESQLNAVTRVEGIRVSLITFDVNCSVKKMAYYLEIGKPIERTRKPAECNEREEAIRVSYWLHSLLIVSLKDGVLFRNPETQSTCKKAS